MIGWDVGGAHLKAARINGAGKVDAVIQVSCPLWRGLDELNRALDIAISQLGPSAAHAATMTGEMVDLFPDRHSGVTAIARTMRQRFAECDLQFYCGHGEFIEYESVANRTSDIASANWRATAEIVASRIERGLLIDIGSTTTDIIAINNHEVCCIGVDDFTRLIAGELVYSGVVRTPLMALADRVAFRGKTVPVIAEHFATSADIYRLLGQLPDGVDQQPTADGEEKSVVASARRIARMIGRDMESTGIEDWHALAQAFRAAQLTKINAAIDVVGISQSHIVGAGIGDFLLKDLARTRNWNYQTFAQLLLLPENIALEATRAAPAVAVALLALDS